MVQRGVSHRCLCAWNGDLIMAVRLWEGLLRSLPSQRSHRFFEHDEICAWGVTPWIATCAEVDQALDFDRPV